MQTTSLNCAMHAVLMVLGAEIPEEDRARMRGRLTYMASCMERDGRAEASALTRLFADALDADVAMDRCRPGGPLTLVTKGLTQ